MSRRNSGYFVSHPVSDMKDMSYYYVYRFFEKVKELGGLQ